jgi:hypothetical protein
MLLAGKAVATAKYFLGIISITIKAISVAKKVIASINFHRFVKTDKRSGMGA